MLTVFTFNKILSLATIGAQVFIALSVAWILFFSKKNNFNFPSAVKFFKFIGEKGIVFAFATSLVASAGSLFYSQIFGFPPCNLCWWQRIFMYPLVLLLGLSLIKKDSKIVDYALVISGAGFLLSLYHNYMHYNEGGLNTLCQFLGVGVSCLKRYVFEFNYITIPMMSLTAFLLIIIFLILHKIKNVR